MYVVGGVEGGSTNVTIPVDLGNDLYLLKVCLHRPKEISCYEKALRNLYAIGAVSNTVSFILCHGNVSQHVYMNERKTHLLVVVSFSPFRHIGIG
jgi:hypothetical protein